MKFGIDQRDSMLTRENFRNTWGRSKANKNKAQSGPEDMVIDRNNTVTKDDVPEMDVEVEGVKETSAGDVAMEATANVNGKESNRQWRKRKMPIYAFQRTGIGAIQSNWQHQKLRQM